MCKKIAFTWKEQQCQSDFMCHELFPHVQILIYMWKKPNTCECDSFTWENVSFTCEKIGSLSFLVLRKGINIDFISVSNCENPSTYSFSNQNCVCTESGTKWLGESFLQAGFSDVTTRNQSRSRMKLQFVTYRPQVTDTKNKTTISIFIDFSVRDKKKNESLTRSFYFLWKHYMRHTLLFIAEYFYTSCLDVWRGS